MKLPKANSCCPHCSQYFERPASLREEAMYAALKDVVALMDEGKLVRDTSQDHHSGWVLKQVAFVQRLSKIVAALELAEGKQK